MVRNLVLAAAAGFLTVMQAGCASLWEAGRRESFHSAPSDAEVYVNGQFVGRTPFETNLGCHAAKTVEFRKEGWESKKVDVTYGFYGGWLLLDILTVVGVVVDAATGCWFYLENNGYFTADLLPASGERLPKRDPHLP